MRTYIATILFGLACTTNAQRPTGDPYNSNPYGSYSSNSNPYTVSSGGSSSSSGSSGSGYTSGYTSGSSRYGEIDYAQWEMLRLIHGVLASLAFVFFFPVGAISIRVIPSKAAIWIHAAFQLLAYALFITAFGIGVYLAREITFPNFTMLKQTHPIIGIVVFAFLFFQPILGLIHHIMFKKHSRRTIWSYAHIWLGRILITLGIINGGLGLRLANNTKTGEIAYGVIAGIIWLIWMAAAVYGEIKRHRDSKSMSNRPPQYKERVSSDDSQAYQSQEFPADDARRTGPAMRTHEYYR